MLQTVHAARQEQLAPGRAGQVAAASQMGQDAPVLPNNKAARESSALSSNVSAPGKLMCHCALDELLPEYPTCIQHNCVSCLYATNWRECYAVLGDCHHQLQLPHSCHPAVRHAYLLPCSHILWLCRPQRSQADTVAW